MAGGIDGAARANTARPSKPAIKLPSSLYSLSSLNSAGFAWS